MGRDGGAGISAGVASADRSAPAASQGRLVVRDRLLQPLLDHRPETVFLIDGPAGSGKSRLAQQWKERDERVHVQIAVSRALDNPAVLAEHIVAALESIGPPAPRTRSIVTASEPTFSAALLPALTALAASRRHTYALVVDDAHLLKDADCHSVLRSVADGVPPGSTLAVLTRERSPAWLAALRADGRLFDIGRDELAFDVSEAASLFEGMGLPIPDNEAERMVEASGGWPVGLYLGALALRRRNPQDGAPGFDLTHGSDLHTRSYVRSQILDHLDRDTRDFLVRTSIIEDLVPALCDAVLDRHDSLAKLSWLDENNQLVIEVDPEQHRFRLHHLLSEVLQVELRTREPELLPTLHVRAAQWYRRHGDLDAAIRHAHHARDLSLLGELVWSGVPACVGSGWPDRLRSWLAPLSDEDIADNRWLTLSAAWSCLQAGDAARMGRWLAIAEEHAGGDWPGLARSDDYSASLAAIEALVGRGGMDRVLGLADASLAGLPPSSPFRTLVHFLRGVALTLAGAFEEGVPSLERARDLSRSLEIGIIEADALSWLGILHLLRGDSAASRRELQAAGVVLAEHDLESLATSAHALGAQALGQALAHDPRAPATLAKARRRSALTAGIAPWFAVSGPLVRARAALALGDRALARQLVLDAKAAMTPDLRSPVLLGLMEDIEKKLQLLAGNGIAATSLTSAELRILQFLPSHLNYPQIGERLFVSQNTVKTHTLSIYRKFGVSTRAEAVTRGYALGLLDEPTRE